MSLLTVLEALALAASLSLDALMASFAYGSAKIRIPFLSVQIISAVCSAVVGVSLFIGSLIRPYLPAPLTTALCVVILFVLGFIKLLDGVTKSIIRKYSHINKELHFSMFNFKFILSLYADPEEADIDASRSISTAEAFSLALALSLDGLAVGFGAALGSVSVPAVIIGSLAANTAAVLLGSFIGNKAARSIKFNFSWLGGAILIILALTKLL